MESDKASVALLYQLFCVELLAWIEEGLLIHPVFERNSPLCPTIFYWCKHKELDELKAIELSDYQLSLFKKVTGDLLYPFNKKGANYNGRRFYAEIRYSLIYENPERLRWIRRFAYEVPNG